MDMDRKMKLDISVGLIMMNIYDIKTINEKNEMNIFEKLSFNNLVLNNYFYCNDF